ncbi:MAG: acyl-CoA dehydrogenase family protein [Thermaerobacter sp.]|nr:acyl-CoA dehydrogenase family protein [Thermaerobacter sp.]
MARGLTEEQQLFQATVRRLSQERVAPRAAAIDREDQFPWDLVALFRENGLLGLGMPEACGGGGADMLTTALAIEEVARVSGTASLLIAVQHLGALPIMLAGTPEQQRRFLTPVAEGAQLAAFALTEPEAGSDAGAARTRAVADGAGWRLTGTKIFITHGSVAKTLVVFAATEADGQAQGMSAFVVPAEAPGFHVGHVEDKLGIHGSETAQLQFDHVRLEPDQLLGRVGEGFKIAMRTLDRSRLGIAAQALGLAQGAFDAAQTHLAERRQFGRALTEFQGLQWMLADMATRIEASRQLLYTACDVVEAAGFAIESSAEVTRLSAMAKLMASDTAMQVTTDAVQLFGGYGYIRDYPVERMMRDAKITQIYEGTNQVQRIVIYRNLPPVVPS